MHRKKTPISNRPWHHLLTERGELEHRICICLEAELISQRGAGRKQAVGPLYMLAGSHWRALPCHNSPGHPSSPDKVMLKMQLAKAERRQQRANLGVSGRTRLQCASVLLATPSLSALGEAAAAESSRYVHCPG